MTLDILKDLLTAMAKAEASLPRGVKNYWSEYLYVSPKPRYARGAFSEHDCCFKSGDTYHAPGDKGPASKSPLLLRYSRTAVKSMTGQCYFVGFGSRATRVLSEVYINWLCRDELRDAGFRVDTSTCGDEGLRGPLKGAEDKLRRMYEVVLADEVLGDIFSHGHGHREGSHAWEWK